MLCRLSISNYALINELTVDFYDGFTAITGETGAGKSIFLDALSFVLGDRADIGVLFNKEKKCVVEAIFRLDDERLKAFFEENDFDFDNECVLRRELTPQKKTRAFINDTPATVQQLKTLGMNLVDIHSQHDSQLITDDSFQLSLIDEAAENTDILERYKADYKHFTSLKKELDDMKERAVKDAAENDFLSFQLEEFQKAKLLDGEYDDVSQRLELLRNSEEIRELMLSSVDVMEQSESSIINKLKDLKNLFDRLKRFVPEAEQFAERVEAARIDLKDIARDVENLSDLSQFDDSSLDELQNRFDLIQNLMMKHHVSNYAELLNVREDIAHRVSFFSNIDENIEVKEKEIAEISSELAEQAEKLHKRRAAAAKTFAEAVTATVRNLSMPYAVFTVECEKTDAFSSTGADKVRFLFSANKGIDPNVMSKVASGGELSRLMLAVKHTAAVRSYISTMIFDEIDTGVSGVVASKLGSMMREMGEHLQIVSITHLPQIASKATNHFFVFKNNDGKQTFSSMKILDKQERITELAKMLSNDKVTESALKAAADLLQTNQ